MEIQFCGAAQTVTGSCHLLKLDDGYKILLDCGLYQGRDEEFEDFNANWIFDPKEINCMILSHAHIDHCGRIPRLVKDGFKGEIICTSATRDLSAVMLIDSAKIQESDAYYTNKRLEKQGLKPDAKPLYTHEDAYDALEGFVGISYDKWHEIRSDVWVQFRDSGHIFGSASVTLKIAQKGKPPVYFGFSGDIGRPDRPILKDPVPMENLDYLICESTYGGRKHHQLPETQGRLPEILVFVDSPMAINATEVFSLHPECFDSDILEYMIEDPNPFRFNDLKYIRKTEDSKKLNFLEGPAIIISASGMMTGGRIVHHLINHIENPNNTILIVGFCAPHTLGAKIRRGDKKVRIFGVERKVNAKVKIMDSYSAHGDQNEMLDYLSNLDRTKLKKIFLVHGDIDRQEKFKEGLNKEGFNNVEIPELRAKYELVTES